MAGGNPNFTSPTSLTPANCNNDRLGANVPVMVQMADGELKGSTPAGVRQTILSGTAAGFIAHGNKNQNSGD